MTEHAEPVSVELVNYRCDECGVADIKPTGILKPMYPPLYGHKCPACGREVWLSSQYPFQRYTKVTP